MVCIAAFIILALIGIFVAIISIFKPKVGKTYLKLLKKSGSCLGKKVRLQKCEIGFKEDVKNNLLSRVVMKHPKWLRPLSILIEILAVVIVVVFVWAVLTAIKSLLALWALGSCNVTKAESCSLGAEVCSIDESEPQNALEATGRWFEEWGEIFGAIPDKFREYHAEDYALNSIAVSENTNALALDILDPGCVVCMKSYVAQKSSGFFDKYQVKIVPFAIQGADDTYKFKNSEIAVRYILAADDFQAGLGVKILDHIFTDRDEDGILYQDLFNEDFSREEAVAAIEGWLKEAGIHSAERAKIREKAESEEITTKMSENRKIVENEIKVKGIPTMIYDGMRHTGLYKAES